MAGGVRQATHCQPEEPTFHPSSPPATVAVSVTKPCDDLPRELPRYRTDFVTYCSATRYFHLPLHTASLQQALDAATQAQAESATLPRFNRDTRDTGCKRDRTKDTVGNTCRGRIVRDTVSPAYCPAATTLPCRSAREEKVTHRDPPPPKSKKRSTTTEYRKMVLCFGKVSWRGDRGGPVTEEVGTSIKSPLMPLLTYQKSPHNPHTSKLPHPAHLTLQPPLTPLITRYPLTNSTSYYNEQSHHHDPH